MPETLSKRLVESARERYVGHLIDVNRLSRAKDPLGETRKARLDLLSDEQAKTVLKTAISFARLSAMPSAWVERELELITLNPKPEWMDQREYEGLSKFVRQLKSLQDERESIAKSRNDLAIELAATNSLKDRVMAQLNMIDRVLNDPDYIDKVEDYDTTFSSGNMKNIKIVANKLRAV